MTQSTTTPTPAAAAPAPATSGRGGLPGSPNPDVRAAVLKDLYKHDPRGAEHAAALRGQARTLGVAFFVFFTCILGGISLSLNGLYPWTQAGRTVVSFRSDPTCGLPAWAGRDEHEAPRLDPGASFEAKAPGLAAPLPATALGPDAPRDLTHYQVRVYVDRTRAGVLQLDLDPRSVTGPLSEVTARASDGTTSALPLLPAWRHAFETAHLAKVVPTRIVMGVGVVMGLLGLLVPAALIPFYKFWMRYVAAPLGWFNTRLILGLVFFLFVTPMGLLARVFGKNRLAVAPLPQGESYWRKRHEQRRHDHFERTF
mgnify:CR=1 FL=1